MIRSLRIVDKFDRLCKRVKLRVNTCQSKITVFEREREETISKRLLGIERMKRTNLYSWKYSL